MHCENGFKVFRYTIPPLRGMYIPEKSHKELSWLSVYEMGEGEGVELSKLYGAENLRLRKYLSGMVWGMRIRLQGRSVA
jgi:hypothetical protein